MLVGIFPRTLGVEFLSTKTIMYSSSSNNLLPTSALSRELSKCGLSEAGQRYVTLAADPFHDFNIRIAGKPDGANGRSLIRNIRQELSITKPTSFAAGKWDCHIAYIPVRTESTDAVMRPITTNLSDHNSTSYGVMVKDAGSISAPWDPQGFIVICKVPNADATFVPQDSSTVAAQRAEYEVLVIDDLTDWTRARLVSGGYEVYNTTELLNKSGSVTDYCQENNVTLGNYVDQWSVVTDDVGGNSYMSKTGFIGSLPPIDLASAKQINGVTRDAAEGSYVTFKLASQSDPPSYPTIGSAILLGPPDSSGLAAGWSTFAFQNDRSSVTGSSMTRRDDFLQSGSYFAGLSDSTSLELVLQAVVEVFPPPGSKDMATASPTAAFDPEAIACLIRIQNKLPPGVPVSENAKGDFFRRIVRVAKDLAKGVSFISRPLSRVPGPVGIIAGTTGGVADVVYEGAKALDKSMTKAQRRRFRKKQKQNQARGPRNRPVYGPMNMPIVRPLTRKQMNALARSGV